eukprot:2680872-Rhodomonas_salina.2
MTHAVSNCFSFNRIITLLIRMLRNFRCTLNAASDASRSSSPTVSLTTAARAHLCRISLATPSRSSICSW